MKKYKLIKEYPLSPQLGFIADNAYSYFCEGYPEFWEEVKEPLFTTEDGKDVYEGDVYYKISSNFNNYYIYKFIASRKSDVYLQENKGYLTFSSKETVQKYIEQNKPQFSLRQVINILKGFDKEVNEFEYQEGEMQYSEYIEKYK